MVFLLAFLIIPLLEIATFILVGDLAGLWPTLGMTVVTAILGAALLRSQSFATLKRARASLDRGDLPVNEVVDGLCLLVAGALLLTPGFVTDAVGFALFVPPLRRALSVRLFAMLRRHSEVRVYVNGTELDQSPSRRPRRPDRPGTPDVLPGPAAPDPRDDPDWVPEDLSDGPSIDESQWGTKPSKSKPQA